MSYEKHLLKILINKSWVFPAHISSPCSTFKCGSLPLSILSGFQQFWLHFYIFMQHEKTKYREWRRRWGKLMERSVVQSLDKESFVFELLSDSFRSACSGVWCVLVLCSSLWLLCVVMCCFRVWSVCKALGFVSHHFITKHTLRHQYTLTHYMCYELSRYPVVRLSRIQNCYYAFFFFFFFLACEGVAVACCSDETQSPKPRV